VSPGDLDGVSVKIDYFEEALPLWFRLAAGRSAVRSRYVDLQARSVRDALGQLGLQTRAGLHTGECELIQNDVRGIAIHLAARISAAAGAGEILVSSTVRDLVAGSGLAFEDRGLSTLKGFADSRRLFAVAGS
jgi:class 3 adenylate cyclase